MPGTPTNHARIIRRLRPLYAGAFLQSFVLWYAIEKLFMTSIGFTAATIGLMAAAYSAVMMLIDIPTGMLADRWSRKGMLIIGSVALAVSSLIQALSQSVPVFIIGATFWGVFFALYSGMYDSIVYDTLSEEHGHSDHYEHYYGRIRIFESIGLICGGLIGGYIGSLLEPRASFYAAIPIALLSIIPLVLFKEPQLHKQQADTALFTHIKATLAAVLQRRSLTQVLVILILATFITDMIFEFYQLWLIGNHSDTAIYGPTNAIILSTIGFAGIVAPRLKLGQFKRAVIFTIICIAAGISFVVVKNTSVIIFALFLTCLAYLALHITFLRQLHDHLPAQVRSGASSTVNSIARILFIIGSLLFGWITNTFNVFAAGWLMVLPIVVVCALLIANNVRHKNA